MTTLTVAGRVPEWTLGDRLRKAREAAGLSQTELADLAGISRRSISKYESDDARPKRPQLIAWAMATGVPLSWLQDGDAPHPTTPDEGQVLPRLDSNQQPSGYTSCEVIELRRAS